MKKEFTVERDGKTFVLYAGLLDEAHQRGLKAITTRLIQPPTPENGNVAICHATVEVEQGAFTGLGDASPGNVNRMMAPHLIRMAETRAKARALRDAVNVGVTVLEELGDVSDGADGGDVDGEAMLRGASIRESPPRPAPAARAASGNGGGSWPGHEGSGDASPKPAGYSVGATTSVTAPSAPPATAEARSTAPAAPAGSPPATPKQLDTIARMARAAGKSVETDGLTRAQASEIISSLIGEMGERRAS